VPSAAYPQKTYLSAEADSDYENRNKFATINQNMYITHQLTNKCDVMSRSIRDIFSSTTKGAALGAMILGSVASPFTASANEAEAEIHPGVTASSTVTTTASARAAAELSIAMQEVRVRDSSKYRKEVVRTGTARASNDRIAIAIYGADRDMLQQVVLAAYQAKQEGIDVVGIVIGPKNETKDIDVFADGVRTTKESDINSLLDRGATVHQVAKITIDHANDYLYKLKAAERRQVADASPIAFERD